MKLLLLLLLLSGVITSQAQDTAQQIKHIDSIVFTINHSALFATSHDSTVQDIPALKLYMKTYLTMVTNGSRLVKYINKGHTRKEENGAIQNLITASAFYYDEGRLIKVEEYINSGDREQRIEWYYADAKPLRFITTPPMTDKETAKLKERETTLVTTAEVLRKAVESKLTGGM